MYNLQTTETDEIVTENEASSMFADGRSVGGQMDTQINTVPCTAVLLTYYQYNNSSSVVFIIVMSGA